MQKAALLVALARAIGVPARLGFAEIRNHIVPEKLKRWFGGDVFPWHGYAELYIDGRWVKATPAFDLKMCQKNRLVPVEFDGRNDAPFPSHNLDGKPHIEYLLQRGHYADVPVEEIRKATIEIFGVENPPPPKR